MTVRFFKQTAFVETSGNPPTGKTYWKCVGTNDEQEVNNKAKDECDETVQTIYGTLYRQNLIVKQTAHKQFTIEVPYGPGQNSSGEWTWDFDTTGATVNLKYAKEEVARFPANAAPDQKGAIGVDGDNVTGADIVIPAMKINVQYRHPEGEITIPQARVLSRHTGKVNSAPFLTYDAGEVLFLGARGSDGTTAEASVNYQFAMVENVSGLSIGDITNIEKNGHDYAWVAFSDDVESAGGVDHPIRVPKFVYIDRVYDRIDLAAVLGFGGN